MRQLNDCSLGVNNHSTLSLHDTAERLHTWCQQSLNSVISPWYSWTIAHLVLTITQLYLSMIQLNDCTLGVNNHSTVISSWYSWTIAHLVLTITQLYLSMIQLNDCTLGVNNHSTVISPWYSWTIAHLVSTITQLCNLSMIQLNDCSLGINNHSTLSLHDTAEWLHTWCQQSLNSVTSPWYSWTIAHLVLTITQLYLSHDTAERLLTWC